jgi:hypothetical protein
MPLTASLPVTDIGELSLPAPSAPTRRQQEAAPSLGGRGHHHRVGLSHASTPTGLHDDHPSMVKSAPYLPGLGPSARRS